DRDGNRFAWVAVVDPHARRRRMARLVVRLESLPRRGARRGHRQHRHRQDHVSSRHPRLRFDKIARMSTSLKDVLTHAKTIAVVGASKDPTKPGATIPMAMQRHGFRVIPVNPTADLLFGQRAYRTLADVPEPVDIVNVFRPPADAPEI